MMTVANDDENKVNDLMISIAWNGIAATQQTIQKIDEKANNTITFSGILMTIIGGILIGLIDKIHPALVFFLIMDLILLSIGMYYAFKTIWLKNQELLDILTSFKSLDLTNSSQATIDLALSMAAWQIRAKEIGNWKSTRLLKSMKFIMSALVFIIVIALVSATGYLFPILCGVLKN